MHIHDVCSDPCIGLAENAGNADVALSAAQPQVDVVNTLIVQSKISLFLLLATPTTALTNCKAIASHIRNIVEQP